MYRGVSGLGLRAAELVKSCSKGDGVQDEAECK